MVFGFGKRKLTPKQRRAKLQRLREEAKLMEEELKEQRKLKQEQAEIKRLQEQLHPSKKRKLVKLLGKAEHGGEKAVDAFLRGEKQFYNEYKKLGKM